MIVYNSRFLKRGEVWFDNEPDNAAVDWIAYHQRPEPLPKGKWRPFYTRVIDLKQNSETLLAAMDGFTASDIKKAQKKDQTECTKLTVDDESVQQFSEFYDRFAAQKGLGPADRGWLKVTADSGRLDLWVARNPEGATLVYHALYREGPRVRSLHLASFHSDAQEKEAQRRIGRASRLLTWSCMQHYREAGLSIYDLGGWYSGTTDTARLGINKFKQSFGGQVICEYEGEQVLTPKARCALPAARFWTRLRKGRHSHDALVRKDLALTPALDAASG